MPRKKTARFRPPAKQTVEFVLDALDRHLPQARCALTYRDPYQLLVATVLSAQCTDERVNQVTPVLFERFPTCQDVAEADVEDLELIIRPTGFYRQKAMNIKAMSQVLAAGHDGLVPPDLDALVKLPGVGRKTANVVLGECFDIPGIVVDTHVRRIAGRLGWTANDNPDKIENDLMVLVPREKWTIFSHQLILLGRTICQARKPRCRECFLSSPCPLGQEALS
ncbi:MAG: endonuclease III [Proteobacteria bacterium]|nr:endonuclease III [Pseudomonadota bacterium]MBU1740960.1 endonuclease III [Pseudomonadota bacterium]